jgi:cold-inducible RNA-binding protein
MRSDNNKIFVGNLDWRITTEELKTIFEKVGIVTDAIVIKDKETQQSRGFGFVTFYDKHDCEIAVGEMDGFEVNGRKLRVNKANPRV